MGRQKLSKIICWIQAQLCGGQFELLNIANSLGNWERSEIAGNLKTSHNIYVAQGDEGRHVKTVSAVKVLSTVE